MKKQEKKVYNLQLNKLKAFDLQDLAQKFWLHLNKNNTDPPNEDKHKGHKVFAGLVFHGEFNHLKHVDITYPLQF